MPNHTRTRGAYRTISILAATTLWVFPAAGQQYPRLRLDGLDLQDGDRVALEAGDEGTGSTNFTLQATSDPRAPGSWTNVANVAVTHLTNGIYRVEGTASGRGTGFYRLRGHGVGTLDAQFVTRDIEATEGDTLELAVEFSGPFHGWLRYTITGLAGPQSGSVYVHGTRATIPLELTEDLRIGDLRTITLTIDSEAGYGLGSAAVATVTVEENDAEWHGTFMGDDTGLSFVLGINASNGVYEAEFRGGGVTFIPTGAVPATVTMTTNHFSAEIRSIAIDPAMTLLGEPLSLELEMAADDGLAGQSVAPTFVRGSGSLTIDVAGHPALSTVVPGTFELLKQPSQTTTNDVTLTPGP